MAALSGLVASANSLYEKLLQNIDAQLGGTLTVNQGQSDPVNDKVSLGASGASTGTLSVHRLLFSANSVNATVVKDSPGVLQKIIVANVPTAISWLKIYDKATAPAQTDTPVMTLMLPSDMDVAGAPGMITFDFGPYGIYFSAGIGYRLCGAAGSADNATTVVALADIVGLHLFSK
jgi:hypothetical protein